MGASRSFICFLCWKTLELIEQLTVDVYAITMPCSAKLLSIYITPKEISGIGTHTQRLMLKCLLDYCPLHP